MGPLKRLELVAKLALALVASALLWRPGRRRRAHATLSSVRKVLLVRLDDRVGEALLTTPLLSVLRQLPSPPRVDVLVHPRVARVLDGHPEVDRVVPFHKRWVWLGAFAPDVRALRREAYDVVVNCANWEVPSVTNALISRLAAARAAMVGPAVWPVGTLADVPVPPLPLTGELAQRVHLLSPLGVGGTSAPRLSFRKPRPSAALEPFLQALTPTPHAVVNPGGRLGWRRLPPEAFAAAARGLLVCGRVPVVTWGPGEGALADEVIAQAPGALRAPPSDLDELAQLMQAAGLVVCNNTGPMHLAVALGVPTLALFFRMPIERWGHTYPPHRMLDVTAVVDSGGDVPAHLEAQTRDFALSLAAAAPPRSA